MTERGEIRNRAYAQQLRNFSGMNWGKITPTDIDGYVEFGDKVFVFFETKFGSAKMPRGQELALERLVDAVGATRHALLVVATHNTPPTEDLQFHDCVVAKYRHCGRWHTPTNGITLREIVDRFRAVAAKQPTPKRDEATA